MKEVLGLLTVKLISTVSSLPYMMVSGSKFKKVFENALIFFFQCYIPKLIRVDQGIYRWGGTKGTGMD